MLSVITMRLNVVRLYLNVLLAGLSVVTLGASHLPAAAAARAGTTLEFGRIAGNVNVAAGYQRPKPLPVFKNRTFCGPAVANETLLIGPEGGLKNAAVILRPRGRQVALRPGVLVLDNKQCAFAPHVQIGVLGSELLLKNSDPILHTVHARQNRKTLFNVGLPKWRQVTKRLERPGVVRIDCDVLHTWMSAAIVVTDTPYFALTDVAGAFKIDGLPVGEYEMEVWHERLGTKSMELVVSNGTSRFIEFVYSSK
jgi:hypothetical protein